MANTVRAMWRYADTRSYSEVPGWDGVVHVITIKRDDERRKVRVWVTAAAQSTDTRLLPLEVTEALWTSGRSTLRGALNKGEPPAHVVVSSSGIDLRHAALATV